MDAAHRRTTRSATRGDAGEMAVAALVATGCGGDDGRAVTRRAEAARLAREDAEPPADAPPHVTQGVAAELTVR